MRDIALLLGVLAALGMTLRYPFVGVILWTWFTLQNPHQEAFGIAHSMPLNLIIVVVTLIAWLLSKEPKTIPNVAMLWLVVIFLCWMTFNSFFAFDPSWSWPFWDRTWKVFALGFLIAAMATNRVRIYALLWAVVISLFYYGVKGGLFTIATGGQYHVNGPDATIISDNNQLALALLMALPIANYLRSQLTNKRVAFVVLAGMILTVIAVLGSYSRGGLIGLAALGCFMLLRVRHRAFYLALVALVVVFAIYFMPSHFSDRMASINNAQQDSSFEGRLYAWKVAFNYACDNFPFGAGFYGPQLPRLFHHYFPNQVPHAAHSIYFQVLGEHGFIGLGLYFLIICAAFLSTIVIIRRTRKSEDRVWVAELATAIQASLFVFCIAGSALSMAYYDLFVVDVMLLLPLQRLAFPLQSRVRRNEQFKSHAGI